MKKIAVMLPVGYRGGSLRAAKNLAKAIAWSARQKNDPIKVVFSYIKGGNYDLYSDFSDLKEFGIALRETVWQIFPKHTFTPLSPILKPAADKQVYDQYCLPVDGANDFTDCDLWLIVSDRLPAPVYPIKKYVCMVYDYLQRYVPAIFGGDENLWRMQEVGFFCLVRNAERVFTTTPSTRADMIAYAGVPGSRIILLDMDFDPPDETRLKLSNLGLPDNYFIWTTNMAAHKNHLLALNALEKYYQDFGGDLDAAITGVNSEYLNVERDFPPGDMLVNVPHVIAARNKIASTPILKNRLHIFGNVSEIIYANILRKSKFLWHTNVYDNGTFSVIEAAYFRRPSLSADYPAMEYINNKFNLNLSFFNPRNAEEMAHALLAMEKSYKNIQLPDRNFLLQNTWKANSETLYNHIIDLL